MGPGLAVAVATLIALVSSGCVTPSPSGVAMPASATVVPADARALRFGASAPEIFNNPQLAPSIRALFGADWNPGPIAFGAPAYFPANSTIRLVRVGDQELIAVGGCVQTACGTHKGLLLLSQDGTRLLARLDEGGYSHYYSHGPGARLVPQPLIDGAWETVSGLEKK